MRELLALLVSSAESAPNRQRLERLRERFAAGVDQATHLDAIHAYRARGSATLSGELASRASSGSTADGISALSRWSLANRWVESHDLTEVLSLEGLRAINAMVTGKPDPWRREDLRLDGYELLPVREIADALGELRDLLLIPVLSETSECRRLAYGVLLYSALSWVHPFADGNGRTLRLACDALFLETGLPPMSFVLPSDAFFIDWRQDRTDIPLQARAESFIAQALSAMERTVEILESGAPEK